MRAKVGPCPKCHFVPWHKREYFLCEVCNEKEEAEWNRAGPKVGQVPAKGRPGQDEVQPKRKG